MRKSSEQICQWILAEGLNESSVESLIDGYSERLADHGFPLLRSFIALQTLHPLYSGYSYVWRRDSPKLQAEAYFRDSEVGEDYLRSPFRYMRENEIPYLRQRVDGLEDSEFPIFERFRRQGASEYLARLVKFDSNPLHTGMGLIASWLTDQPSGFSEEQLALVEETFQTFALAMRTKQVRDMAATITETYLGRDAGRRVLAGALDRGEVTKLRAVILFTDLRGFTAMSEVLPGKEIVELLDQYFDVLAQPVLDRGGEVLKFMGDGMLAVFEINDDSDEACGRAMAAVLDANQRIEEMNARREASGEATMPADMVLHLGDVLYGNVGAEGRLDFTVIGKAVNEASRIEAECERLGHHILMSKEFADAAFCCAHALLPLGKHRLRDIPNPLELYTVKPEMLNKAA